MASRGFTDLSPPEARHALLELPTNRAEYVGVLQDMGDYPRRSPIGRRVPHDDEVAALARLARRWRAIALLDDERALKNAARLFRGVFVLDPFYDTGAELYAAWHDPVVTDEQPRRFADQAALLVRAAPLLSSGTAVLAPDHLPGSWNPRPAGWRRPRPTDDIRQRAGWAMRTCMVLLYWADRLDGVVCAALNDVIAGLDLAFGPRASSSWVDVAEPHRIEDAQASRESARAELDPAWAVLRGLSRRRTLARLDDIGFALTSLGEMLGPATEPCPWRLSLGEASVPEPALLIRRVLNGEDPERAPPLPRSKIKRRPLSLVAAAD
jgi:hypothetical protein